MSLIRYYVAYFQHQLTANSRHGTHSPFVYRLVDEVIYAKQHVDQSRNKVERLTERLVERFQPQQVYRLGADMPNGQLDFVIIETDDDPATAECQLRELFPKLHQDSVLVVTNIYRNARMKRFWQSIKAKSEVTVTIDLFHVGLVFFHLGQAKEDFSIRF